MSNLLTGTVFKSTGSHYKVVDQEGTMHLCIVKGKMRMEGWKSTNPVAVGDQVDFKLQQDGPAIIHHIHERTNAVVRKATNQSKQKHTLAANLDQAMIIASLVEPRVSEGFIDRYLVTCEAYDVPAIIVFNKIDLLGDVLSEILEELAEIYRQCGYQVLSTSVKNAQGLEELKAMLAGKTTLLSGFSGVGKSSLVNTLFPELSQKTAEISGFSGKGKHTTTFAEMFEPLPGLRIIDTPGIKELGLIDISGPEIAHFMPDLKPYTKLCKFHNCSHTHEPGCALRQAAEEGEVADSRYGSYLSMLANEDQYR